MAITPNQWQNFGGAMQIGGIVQGFIANSAAASYERYKLKSQGLTIEHQQDMAEINADMLESQAQQIGRAYNRQLLEQVLLLEVYKWVLVVLQMFLLLAKL